MHGRSMPNAKIQAKHLQSKRVVGIGSSWGVSFLRSRVLSSDHDNFLPIHKKMEELSNGGGTNTEQLRTELNICSLQKVKVIAEECAIMYKGLHMLYWNESVGKVMNRQVRDILFWRLYHDAHEFLKTGCTPVTAAEETTDTEMTDALVVATKKLDLSF